MKKIEAVIRIEKFDDVREALEKQGYPGMMITHIEGHGRQKGLIQQFRGRKYRLELLSKMKIEVVVSDKDVVSIVKTIVENARTGEIGDGKIFIHPVEDAVRIRTGETGEIAL